MASAIKTANVIVAVGSVDGIAGTAAYMRYANNPHIQLIFTQAFQVHTIDVSKWTPNSKVGLIDLAVNNEGQSPNPQLTIDFINRVHKAGHEILFIADEHNKKAWNEVLERCNYEKEKLLIQPEDRTEKYSSSCAILSEAFGDSADAHTKALLHAGDQADRMNFDTPFGNIFNTCTKSNMSDPNRRPYVVQHMAFHETPDEKIQGWMNEYAEIKANQPNILASRKDLGNGMALYDGAIGRHDATALFNEAYKANDIVVLTGTPVFLEGKMQSGVSIATKRKDLNVLEIIQKAGIAAGGMPAKANFALQDREAVIGAIRKAIQ